jgi:hypothetical protein
MQSFVIHPNGGWWQSSLTQDRYRGSAAFLEKNNERRTFLMRGQNRMRALTRTNYLVSL